MTLRVLLADDSLLILDRLRRMLANYEQVEIVGLFKNGAETLAALRILKPDLAIVDIRMPGLSGLEVIREFRKENKSVKFIVLTFFASDYIRQAALRAGANYFINKVDFEKVSLLIAELTANKENLKSIIQEKAIKNETIKERNDCNFKT